MVQCGKMMEKETWYVCGQELHVLTNVACSKIVASHVDGEKAMKERKFESLQKKVVKIKNAKIEMNEKERV